jgi:hypothetical protein
MSTHAPPSSSYPEAQVAQTASSAVVQVTALQFSSAAQALHVPSSNWPSGQSQL